MKRNILLTILIIAASIITTHAQNYKTALGIRFSNADATVNNSISIKHFITSTTALEGLVSFGDPFAIGALVELQNSLSNSENLNWFYGGGVYAGFGGGRNFGAMGVVGLDYKFNAIPLNLSVDWKPELNIVRDFTFEPAAVGLSARFTF